MRQATVLEILEWFPKSTANRILNLKRVLLSLSGGVDSSVMLALLAGVVPKSGMNALIFRSFLQYPGELDRAAELCRELKVPVAIVEGPELSDERVLNNDARRCEYCKSARVLLLDKKAAELDAVIVDGTNADDIKDVTRLGNRVLERCRNVFSPFADGGIVKTRIREIGAALALPWAYEPATACLATRFPQNYTLNAEQCLRGARAEAALKAAGFNVRLRICGNSVCLELPPDNSDVVSLPRTTIKNILSPFAFDRIMVDLDGYKTGRKWLPER